MDVEVFFPLLFADWRGDFRRGSKTKPLARFSAFLI